MEIGDFHPAGFSERVLSEEFDGSALNRGLWCTRYLYPGRTPVQIPDPTCQKYGAGSLDYLNDEKSRYVDFNRLGEAMHVVRDGVLTLRTTRTRSDPAAPYESAMIRSKFLIRPDEKLSYYVTARVKLPDVRGTWPAFWLNSDFNTDGSASWPPEIDIFEGALNDNWDTRNMLSMKAQAQNWGGQGSVWNYQVSETAADFDVSRMSLKARGSLRETWIETGVEWTSQQVCFYVEGRKLMCQAYEWKTNQGLLAAPAHILVNLGIGGAWAGAFGIDDSKMPTQMQVDHIRVYRRVLP